MVDQFPSFTSTSTSTATTGTKQQQQTNDDEEPDAEYIEELLLQVLLDEFEVNVDDESGFDVATEIIRLRGQCSKGNFEDVDRLLERWQSRKGSKVVFKQGEDQDNDTDWDDTDGEDGGDQDEEMDEAPPLVATKPKEKQAPEVDDDGFTKVTRKR